MRETGLINGRRRRTIDVAHVLNWLLLCYHYFTIHFCELSHLTFSMFPSKSPNFLNVSKILT